MRVRDDHRIPLAVGVYVLKHGELARAPRLRRVPMWRVQVLLHDGGVRTLRKLAALLDAAMTENAATQRRVTRLLGLLLARHLELLKRRLRKLLLNLLLEVDELKLDLRINVALAL